ncbi:uncharacterized protein LOC117102969 [Anneissia japonica]|uniref:uncharacterized protein LOC117102969 n=1 Tax=Anneissia japonica TaxID=1529436 RepID=UPI0014255C4F|nr:uncharacterized protein LOC117102969 [Anneissia japonica]
METLVTKGQARKIHPDKVNEGGWYLPHHPVLHPQKPDKVRVVFDCSATYRGCSLNDKLLQGLDLTNTLIGIMMRFRLEEVAFMADIEAMFYQVRVSDKDSQKTADDNSGFDDAVTNTVRRNFYVDDCLKSVATENEAVHLSQQLRDLLKTGGFRLTKWVCNSKEVLDKLPESENAPSVMNLGDDVQERVLGIRWYVNDDNLGFNVAPKLRPLTRRGILCVVSSVYDSMGFASPCVLPAKQILQDLFRQGIGWDNDIPENIRSRWNKWVAEITLLKVMKISRCYKPSQFKAVESELHHFSDALTVGYGDVSYLVQGDSVGNVCSSLIIAKSNLAPIKSTTIPRL